MLMSRRYWSSDPSSDEDLRDDVVTAIDSCSSARGPTAQRRAQRASGGTEHVARRRTRPPPHPLGYYDLSNALPEPLPADTGEPRETLRAVGGVAVVDQDGAAAHE